MGNAERKTQLWQLGVTTIKELEVEGGILASGKEEIYGCIFGRDSLITSLKLLKVYETTRDPYFLGLVRKVLFNLAGLQGKEINLESGEEPGKCIHEFRPTNHSHLTESAERWYVYGDGIMRNYDTVDATPLFLMACHEYARLSDDDEFIKGLMPSIKVGLNWILEYGDQNGDELIDYRFHPERTHGGLKTQSWMDSIESVFHEDGSEAPYPIAPVEAQAYAFSALKSWSRYFSQSLETVDFADTLRFRADRLKERFNSAFVIYGNDGTHLAFAVDGNGKPLISARSSMGHVLWASYKNENGDVESILNNEHIPRVVARLMKPDLFVPGAGIRTLSTKSKAYDPFSYHNGSIWPHDTAIIAEGMRNFGFYEEADLVRDALFAAYIHFETPIELFTYPKEGDYAAWVSPSGQTSCKKQAWSAASLLTTLGTFPKEAEQSLDRTEEILTTSEDDSIV